MKQFFTIKGGHIFSYLKEEEFNENVIFVLKTLMFRWPNNISAGDTVLMLKD